MTALFPGAKITEIFGTADDLGLFFISDSGKKNNTNVLSHYFWVKIPKAMRLIGR